MGEKASAKYTGKSVIAHVWREEKTTSGGTKTIDRGSDAAPFYVRDETGSVPVDPSGAEIRFQEKEVERGHTKRRLEGYLTEGDDVCVRGERCENERTVYVGDGEDVAEFVISDSSELGTSRRQVYRNLPLPATFTLLSIVLLVFIFSIFGVLEVP